MSGLLAPWWERLVMAPWLVGDPSLSGRSTLRRVRLLVTVALVLANAVGATVVLSLAVWALPEPDGGTSLALRLTNVAVAVGYLLAALVAGVAWGRRSVERGPDGVAAWLVPEVDPTPRQRARLLRAPLRVTGIQAVLWALAAVVFAALNAPSSWLLALEVAVAVSLGGLTTSAAAYLLVELANRPVTARALARGVPDRPGVPGVALRSLTAWALGTGVPLLGLLLVAVLALTPLGISRTELAVTTLALTSTALVFGALLALLSAYATVHPLGATRRALARLRSGDLDARLPVWDATETGQLAAGFNDLAEGLRERERIRDLFGRAVGEDAARQALSAGVQLGGEVREVAVLMVDVVGSTELAATRPPQEVVALLNRLFAEAVDVVESCGGWVDKFAGDAALVVFGAPLAVDDPAGRALRAARELRARLAERVPELATGIGVSAGPVVAGHLGTQQRFEYTVIGDPVNEAARLTDLAKTREGCVLASAAALDRAGPEEAARWELGDEVVLRGRPVATRLALPR